MARKVLRNGNHSLPLKPLDPRDSHTTYKIGRLPISLLSSAPTNISNNIEYGRPGGPQMGSPRLDGSLLANQLNQIGIKSCRQGNCLREQGGAGRIGLAVQSFRLEQGRHLQPLDPDRSPGIQRSAIPSRRPSSEAVGHQFALREERRGRGTSPSAERRKRRSGS